MSTLNTVQKQINSQFPNWLKDSAHWDEVKFLLTQPVRRVLKKKLNHVFDLSFNVDDYTVDFWTYATERLPSFWKRRKRVVFSLLKAADFFARRRQRALLREISRMKKIFTRLQTTQKYDYLETAHHPGNHLSIELQEIFDRTLTTVEQLVVTMVVLEESSYKEVAVSLKLSVSTVARIRATALNKLEKYIR